MAWLTLLLGGLLRAAARLLPAGRRPWAEAVQAEAGEIPAGWPRLHWLAGGLWLVAREANVVRKVVYWLGAGTVAAAAAWAIWLSWYTAPAADPQAVTDRVRVLVGVAALVVLPWVGRRHGWFGPVGRSVMARLVRVAGCAAMCGLGVVVVRMDTRLTHGAGVGPFSMLREIVGVVLFGALLATPIIKARWPQAETEALWAYAGTAGLLLLIALPLQVLAIGYVALILAVTSRRSPVASLSLAVGSIVGVAAGLGIYELVNFTGDLGSVLFFIVVAIMFLAGVPAGLAAAWLPRDTEGPREREARIRQAMLAGAVAGAVTGVLLRLIFVLAVFLMIVGPVAGAMAGVVGGVIAADRPRASRPGRSWAAGLFVLGRTR